jgi:hypothetical protein
MKKLYALLAVIAITPIHGQVQDKWDTVFKYFPNPSNVEFRLRGLKSNSNDIILFGDSVFDPSGLNNVTTNAKKYSLATNTITNIHFPKSSFDVGYTSNTSVNTNTPGVFFNYFTTENTTAFLSNTKTLYKQNSQSGLITTETFTANNVYQYGYTHVAGFSPGTNNDSLTIFEKDMGIFKILRKKFNQLTPLLTTENLAVNNVEKSIIFNNKLLIAATSITNSGVGQLYESSNGITFTLNTAFSAYIGSTIQKITEMEVFNGYLYLALYDSDGNFSIIRTNNLTSFTQVSTVNSGNFITDMQVYKNKLWFVYKYGSGPCSLCGGRPTIELIESNTATTSIISTDTLGRSSNAGEYFKLAVANNSLYLIGGNNNVANLNDAGIFVYRLKTPTANFTPTNVPLSCNNAVLTFSNNSQNADSVRWIKDNNFFASTGNTFSTTFSSSGTHTIGLIAIIGTLKDTLITTFSTYSVSAGLSLLNGNACTNSSITVNSSVVNGVSPLSYTFTQTAPTTSIVSTSSNLSLFNLTAGIKSYSFIVRDVNNCAAIIPSYTFNVLPAQVINVNVTSTLAAVNGSVTLYRFEPMFTKFDSIDTKPINAGIASFTAAPSNSYIAMAIPSATNMQVTYGNSSQGWFNANVFPHGCLSATSSSINVLSINNIGSGPGVLTGTVVEGIGFGNKNISIVPGGPVKGVLIKIGREPGGDVVAQGRTLPDGTYTISNLPLNNSGESYRIIPDIPGLDTNGTYQRTILGTNTTFANLDFVVDSAKINTTNMLVGIKKELSLFGNVVLYPNPAKEKLMLKFNLNTDASVSIEAYDVIGNVVLNNDNLMYLKQGEVIKSVDVNTLENGVYFIIVTINRQKALFKLIVQH